jgi:hypothetical protein
LLPSLKDGRITADDWTKQCVELGIAGMNLGQVAPAAAVSANQERQG